MSGKLVLVAVTTAALGACAGPASTTPTGGPTTTTPAASGALFAITGTVTAEPACPGPQRAGSPCPPRFVAGARVELSRAGAVVATTTTDPAGRFRFDAGPGDYRVTAHNVGLGSEAGQDVTVTGPVDLRIVVDSGLR